MEKKVKKPEIAILYSAALIAAITILGLIGAYAYAINVTKRNQIVDVNTVEGLKLVYQDCSSSDNSTCADLNSDLQVGESVSKVFEITNTSVREIKFAIYFNEVVNTFKNNELAYKLELISGTIEEEIVPEKPVPYAEEKLTNQLIKTNILIPANSTQKYKLTITFLSKDYNQNDNLNASYMIKTGIGENVPVLADTSKVPMEWRDNGLFSEYYESAYEKLEDMTLEEKIGQLLIVRYNSSTINDAITNYHVGGTTYYAVDFDGKTEEQVKAMTAATQAPANIPLITAVDEEGGKVVRVSSNPNLVAEPFKSPRELYEASNQTFDSIIEDTKTKSAVLKNLGLNMNFAPDVDIADSTAYIYDRTLGYGTEKTAEYAVSVVRTSKGTGVSYSLKHFPGYGNNADTHTSSSTDETSLEELWSKHLIPFKEGINAGAESVMISHNIVAAVDKENPSSLSRGVHDILFNDLHFTGIAITDDMDMDGTANVDKKYTKALLAGNNIILLSKYADAQTEIKASIQEGLITEDEISHLAFKVLAWKYYKGLLK